MRKRNSASHRMERENNMYQITNLTKKFGQKTILHEISLSVESNKTTVIIGPSGSGKTTLLRCMNILEIPDGGELNLQGDLLDFNKGNVTKKDILKFRQRTGMVFQSFNLFPNRTALGNVIEGPITVLKRPKKEAEKQGLKLLEKVGLLDKKDAYPAQLSGGQQQRIAIARALAMEPEVLLFDEPTSALDPELEIDVLNLIKALSDENYTIAIVTHKMSFAKEVSDQIIFLEDGKILKHGSYEDLSASSNQRVRQYLSMF